ncbi:hypothetical protein LZ198_15930 [Myxococcus sp. K15C18031901]|uniref:hypothetical protein n=1 Tax=Myxococcus dinghuensis TaxID=2906761 RepID=UPI0020A753AE|nr:hypothetical protein [Myxococcus dinghuensis]MCP3100358.1 hypothetical protein [Myxococcus dinghuensis]
MNGRLELRSVTCWVALSVLLGAVVSCVKRPVDYEREFARTLAPTKLETQTPSASQSLRPLRVRVYADSDYRDQVLRWRSTVVAQLQRASAVVRGPLGVVFELESTREWAHRGVEGELEKSLVELETLDPGEDVDLVIGFVSSLKFFSSSQHELGMARMFGRHCVLREMGNPEEVRAIMGVLTHLPEAERESLYHERKLHKETSVLLHEWAHTLGAFHVGNSHWMMFPSYAPNQGAFAPQTMELLATSLRHASNGRRDAAAAKAWATELGTWISSTTWPDWEGPEKDAVVDWLAKVREGKVPLGPRHQAPPMARDDQKRLEEILSLDQQGRVEMAAQQVEPLARRYPEDARVQGIVCYLGTRAAPTLPATREQCEATAEHFRDAPQAPLHLAALDLRGGRPLEAQAQLLRARQRMAAQPATPAALWNDLAAFFKETGAVTYTEQALERAAGGRDFEALRSWTSQTRRWLALPTDVSRSGVAMEREGELVRAAKEVEVAFDKGPTSKVQSRLAWMKREFPRAAILHVFDCEVHLRAGRLGPARAACREAVAAHDEAVQAHFILGWLATNAGRRAEAREHLERVVTLEPRHMEAWRLLADQYRAVGMAEALKQLQTRYREEFAAELR